MTKLTVAGEVLVWVSWTELTNVGEFVVLSSPPFEASRLPKIAATSPAPQPLRNRQGAGRASRTPQLHRWRRTARRNRMRNPSLWPGRARPPRPDRLYPSRGPLG